MTQPNPLNAPTTSDVDKFHTNDGADSSATTHHHTLGIGQNQSSPGSHNHNGKNSKRIGKGLDLAFPSTASATYSQAQIQSIINALRNLGLGT